MSRPVLIRLILAVVVSSTLGAAPPAPAVVLKPGDILVTDSEAGAVIRVNPITGAQTVVSSGTYLISPAGIAIGPTGHLYVAQNAAVLGDLRAIIRIDPATGAQTIVSSGGILESLRSVAIDGAGRVLVAQGDSAVNGIIHVDPGTGAQSLVSSGGMFVDPTGLAIESSGQLVVVDQEASALIRVDPITGAQAQVTSGGNFGMPIGIALEPGGQAAITNEPGRALVRTDLATGQQSVISSGGLFDHPFGVAVEADSRIVVTNGAPSARILRVDPVSGQQTEITSGGNFLRPAFVVIVPPRRLTALGPAKVWVGLKNSDDVGTRFDLKAEVYKDDALIGSGQLTNAASGSSGFNNAKLHQIPLTLLAPVDVAPGTMLGLRLSVRITCSGKTHASGTARLWFNDPQASSRFDATIAGLTENYYLLSLAALGTAPGPGPKKTLDVPVGSSVRCPARPFTPFGTWTITLP